MCKDKRAYAHSTKFCSSLSFSASMGSIKIRNLSEGILPATAKEMNLWALLDALCSSRERDIIRSIVDYSY